MSYKYLIAYLGQSRQKPVYQRFLVDGIYLPDPSSDSGNKWNADVLFGEAGFELKKIRADRDLKKRFRLNGGVEQKKEAERIRLILLAQGLIL
jgi:hypothetical protein